MKTREIAPNILLISECPRPVSNEVVCNRLADAGVNSLLVVDEDTTPWPSGQGRLWCYVRPFANPQAPSPPEVQRITDFVRYETSHARSIGIWIGYAALEELVLHAAIAEPVAPQQRGPSDDPCCCRPYHEGCLGSLVCHATPVESASEVFQSGELLSRPMTTRRSLQDITREMREWGQSDPPDYFDFVCLANGNCVAPDKVAMERHAGTWMTPEQCDKHFYPGVRLFFDPNELAFHPSATWDGIHPIKIRDRIELNSYLVAAVMPEVERNGTQLRCDVPSELEGRVLRLDHRRHHGLAAWSSAAFQMARDFMSNKPDVGDGK